MPSVLNRSTVVTDDECRRMAAACDVQLRVDFCPAWELAPWRVWFDRGAYIYMVVVDEDKDVPGALAYHDLQDGRPVGVVMAKTCLDAGLGLAGVCSALSHEILETRADPYCNYGSENSDGWEYWLEVCDAVQRSGYLIDGLEVSNFCLKHWFNPEGDGPFDFMGNLDGPFSLEDGGYQVRRRPGSDSTVHGEAPAYHGWRSLKRVGL